MCAQHEPAPQSHSRPEFPEFQGNPADQDREWKQGIPLASLMPCLLDTLDLSMLSSSPQNSPSGGCYHQDPHFTDEETAAQGVM